MTGTVVRANVERPGSPAISPGQPFSISWHHKTSVMTPSRFSAWTVKRWRSLFVGWEMKVRTLDQRPSCSL